jgi:hypothetical protein
MAGGRPSKYDPELSPILAGGYAKDGLTESEIAAKLQISVTTLNTWKREFPQFRAAIKTSKDAADIRVEQSLYKRALGGDVAACIFWLKNRRRDKWREKPDPGTSEENLAKIDVIMKRITDDAASV